MHQTSIDHHSPISAWIALQLGAGCKSRSQLSFALFFMPFRAFSDKKHYPNFRYVSGGGNFNLQGGAIYASSGANVEIHACTFKQNNAENVSGF